MTHAEILLIAGPASRDDELVAAAAGHRPRHVTVLIDVADGGDASDRLAGLLTAIERATGAVVVGLVGAAARLDAGAFDAVVRPRPLLHAA